MVDILSQTNLVHILSTDLPQVHFYLILKRECTSSKRSCSFKIQTVINFKNRNGKRSETGAELFIGKVYLALSALRRDRPVYVSLLSERVDNLLYKT
jgi:hypothetical protein